MKRRNNVDPSFLQDPAVNVRNFEFFIQNRLYGHVAQEDDHFWRDYVNLFLRVGGSVPNFRQFQGSLSRIIFHGGGDENG